MTPQTEAQMVAALQLSIRAQEEARLVAKALQLKVSPGRPALKAPLAVPLTVKLTAEMAKAVTKRAGGAKHRSKWLRNLISVALLTTVGCGGAAGSLDDGLASFDQSTTYTRDVTCKPGDVVLGCDPRYDDGVTCGCFTPSPTCIIPSGHLPDP